MKAGNKQPHYTDAIIPMNVKAFPIIDNIVAF